MTLMQKYFFKIKLINLLISGSLLATQPDTFINGIAEHKYFSYW